MGKTQANSVFLGFFPPSNKGLVHPGAGCNKTSHSRDPILFLVFAVGPPASASLLVPPPVSLFKLPPSFRCLSTDEELNRPYRRQYPASLMISLGDYDNRYSRPTRPTTESLPSALLCQGTSQGRDHSGCRARPSSQITTTTQLHQH